jgi:hypothetical protein
MYVYARKHREVFLQQVIGPHDKIPLFVTVDMYIGNLQVAIHIRRKRRVHRIHFKCIGNRYGIEDGLKIVITIGALLYDIESQIDFTDGK